MKDFTIKKGNYTTTQNDIFRAEINGAKLTPEAWGLYVFMLSLPDTWDYTILGLTKVVNAGKNKIQRIIKELENAGFIRRYQENAGVFGKMKYEILHSPETENVEKLDLNNENNKEAKDPYPQNPPTENPFTGKLTQQKTNKQKTNKQSNNDIDKLKIKGQNAPAFNKNYNFHFLTKELINKKFISALDYDLIKYDNLFYELDNNYNFELVLNATRYLVDNMKNDKDYYTDKYSYFEKSIYNNLELLQENSFNKNLPDYIKEFMNSLHD